MIRLIYIFLLGAVFGYLAGFNAIWIKAVFAIAVVLILIEHKVYGTKNNS